EAKVERVASRVGPGGLQPGVSAGGASPLPVVRELPRDLLLSDAPGVLEPKQRILASGGARDRQQQRVSAHNIEAIRTGRVCLGAWLVVAETAPRQRGLVIPDAQRSAVARIAAEADAARQLREEHAGVAGGGRFPGRQCLAKPCESDRRVALVLLSRKVVTPRVRGDR